MEVNLPTSCDSRDSQHSDPSLELALEVSAAGACACAQASTGDDAVAAGCACAVAAAAFMCSAVTARPYSRAGAGCGTCSGGGATPSAEHDGVGARGASGGSTPAVAWLMARLRCDARASSARAAEAFWDVADGRTGKPCTVPVGDGPWGGATTAWLPNPAALPSNGDGSG